MDRSVHLTNLTFFLLWAERSDPNMMYGLITVSQAVEGLAEVMQVPVENLREMI